MTDTALSLLQEAMHLRMYGEYAPGGKENWRDWDTRATAYLMGTLPDSPPAGKPGVSGDGSPDFSFDASADYAGIPDYPVIVFGPGGTAYVEPISEYYRKREVASPSEKFSRNPS